MGSGNRWDKDIDVVISKLNLDSLELRILSDRDSGQIIWETRYLDDDGKVIDQVDRKLLPVELKQFKLIIACLNKAIEDLSPWYRLDLAKLDPPDGVDPV